MPNNYRLGLIMDPNITCRALVLKTADQAQSMYIGNLNKQIWALNTYIGPGPEVLSSNRPTIYNHASWSSSVYSRTQTQIVYGGQGGKEKVSLLKLCPVTAIRYFYLI